MRVLIAVVLAAALAWSGYWVIGQRRVQSGAQAAFARLRAAGWQAGAREIAVRGFPNRFDTTFTEPRLARDAVAWRAPFLKLLRLSYRTDRAILAFPPSQTLTLAGDRYPLRSGRMRASLAFGGRGEARLSRVVLVGHDLSIGGAGGGVRLAELRLAMRGADAGPRAHEVGVGVDALKLPAGVAPPGLPAEIGRVHGDAVVTLDAPLDAGALGRLPRVTKMRIESARLRWGVAEVTVSGTLAPGPEGYATGSVTFSAEGWQPLLSAARARGWVGAAAADRLRGRAAADAPLTATLAFRGGEIRLGPSVLGPAPRLAPPG